MLSFIRHWQTHTKEKSYEFHDWKSLYPEITTQNTSRNKRRGETLRIYDWKCFLHKPHLIDISEVKQGGQI